MKKIGIFDHASNCVGGGQLVVAWMAMVLSDKYEVELIHSGKGYTLSSLAAAFELDLSRVKERIFENNFETFAVLGHRSMMRHVYMGWRANYLLTKPYDLFIYSGHHTPPFCYARQGLVYCLFPVEPRPRLDPEESKRRDRWIRWMLYDRLWEQRMHGYPVVLADSNFTANWIQQLWRKTPKVMYPPVPLKVTQVVKKQNLILSISRFVNTDQKNLALQLKAFPEFLSRTAGNWKLCLVGFCTDSPKDRAYLEKLRSIANDLPVTFAVNAERKTVIQHLAEAKLFWHTRGLENGENGAPQSMEHFGISTVEAMAAGCVPVVPAYGGQPEIVDHQVSGFLCRNMGELVDHSVRLANDDDLRAQMSHRAIERSNLFRPEIFEQSVCRLVDGYLARQ
jgi:glycosyltransferase involved in cell wall biosynthesis